MKDSQESTLGQFYRRGYEFLCGKHPNLKPWHFQWLDTIYLRRALNQHLPKMKGRVLDVGCGKKPYRELFSLASTYIGIDITEGDADVVINANDPLPFENEYFDVIFATQVVEHVENLPFTMNEIMRVSRPGAAIILSFPFLYNEHGTPYDFRRFTTHGAARLLPYTTETLDRQGGFGSTVVVMTLNWLNDMQNSNRATRIFKAVALPLWIPFCYSLNMLGLLLDTIDITNKYYNNIFLIFRKPQ